MLRRVSREEDLKSSFGARLGPAPSWTHASAAVKVKYTDAELAPFPITGMFPAATDDDISVI